jgi:hypothetical protein
MTAKNEIGHFHTKITELRHEGGEAFLFVALGNGSKSMFTPESHLPDTGTSAFASVGAAR